MITSRSAIVKSSGCRSADENLRRTNPRCAVRRLWGFEELVLPGVTGTMFTRLPGVAVPGGLSGDWGTDPRPPMGKAANSGGGKPG